LLLGQDFLREVEHTTKISLYDTAARISVLDVVDDEGAIAASRKEEVIVERNTHPLDPFCVSLDLIDLFEVALPDLDRTWTVLLTHASEESLTAGEVCNLAQSDFCVAA